MHLGHHKVLLRAFSLSGESSSPGLLPFFENDSVQGQLDLLNYESTNLHIQYAVEGSHIHDQGPSLQQGSSSEGHPFV
jgi:hypothetical protein